MNGVPDKVVARVRKMLALANDAGATEGERDNAMRMAHATLAKYNLDLAEVEASGQTVEGEERGITQSAFYGRPWARAVCASVAELFFCRHLYMPAKIATDTRHLFIGRKSNATTAAELSQYVVTSIQREARKRARAIGEGNTWVRSFCIGAARAVQITAARLKAEAETAARPVTGSGKEIVLANLYALEKTANDALVQTLNPRAGGHRGKTTGDQEAAAAGERYGETIQLNRQVGHDKSSKPRHLLR